MDKNMKPRFRLEIVRNAGNSAIWYPEWWCRPMNDAAKDLAGYPNFMRFYAGFL